MTKVLSKYKNVKTNVKYKNVKRLQPQPTKIRSSAGVASDPRLSAACPDLPVQPQALHSLLVRILALSLAAFAPQLFKVLLSLCLLRIPPFSSCFFFSLLLYGLAENTFFVKPSRIFPRRTNFSFFSLATITV